MWRIALSAVALLCAIVGSVSAEQIRVTTWNMEWFPTGSPNAVAAAVEANRITEAAAHLRTLDSDVVLLQEIRDWDSCERLAAALAPLHYEVLVCSAFRDSFSGIVGKQQVAILAKRPAQAAWSDAWKHKHSLDPSRGFAFAAIRYGRHDVGFYSLHLKSNLVRRNGDLEAQFNIAKRELAIDQLSDHVKEIQTRMMPTVDVVIVGGDFNTNKDQSVFVSERTLDVMTSVGFKSVFGDAPLAERITHPGRGRYPDATFDYIFLKSAKALTMPRLVRSPLSDHLSVTCDIQTAAE